MCELERIRQYAQLSRNLNHAVAMLENRFANYYGRLADKPLLEGWEAVEIAIIEYRQFWEQSK